MAVDASKRDDYLIKLMAPPNATWSSVILQAQSNPEVLKQQEVIKSLQNVLQVRSMLGTLRAGKDELGCVGRPTRSCVRVGGPPGVRAARSGRQTPALHRPCIGSGCLHTVWNSSM